MSIFYRDMCSGQAKSAWYKNKGSSEVVAVTRCCSSQLLFHSLSCAFYAGMSGRGGQRLMRTVSSSFPVGAAVVASPSGAHRQRSCRGSLDVLRSASCGVSKLVASTRNVTLKVGGVQQLWPCL